MTEGSADKTVRVRRPIGFLYPPQPLEPCPMPLEMVARSSQLARLYDNALASLGWDARMRRDGLAWSLRSTSERPTRLAHVGTVAFSWAITQVLADAGITPDVIFGHSLGLHSALAASGATLITDTLEVVDRTARFLAERRPDEERGAMAAVTGFAPDEVARFCDAAEPAGSVFLAIINSPRQVVISGQRKPVDRLVRRLRARQAWRLKRLPTRLPLHTPLMAPFAGRCADLTDRARCHVPHIRLIHPATGEDVRTVSCVKRLWQTHLLGMIDYVRALQAMERAGVATFIEVGLGETLRQLGRWHRRDLPVFTIGHPQALERILNARVE